MIRIEFKKLFEKYVTEHNKPNLRFVVTSSDRPNDPPKSPHKIPGNALDFSLRTGSGYSVLQEYNELFLYMMKNWQYRAGIDNTEGNVHIHIDLGKNKATLMPYFFKEDGGKFQWEIVSEKELYKTK